MLANRLKNKHHHGSTLNLEKVRAPLGDNDGLALAKLIEQNDPSLRHIKTTDTNFSRQTIYAIAKALEKNIYITQFTFNYKNATVEQERKIKWQLILNKAQKRIMASVDKPSKTRKIFVLVGSTVFTFFQFLKTFSWQAALACTLVYQALQQGLTKHIHHSFRSHHLSTKQENSLSSLRKTPSYVLGKRCAHESLIWLHPKAWTPLAYLGHAIEKDKLENHYGLEVTARKKRRS